MKIKSTFIYITLMTTIIACTTNPFTGKQTLALVPNSQILPMSFQQYGEFLSENKVIKGTSDANRIKNIGQKIATASERWLNANGYAGYLKEYQWDYNLVQDDAVNAWCMPGGKIVFYTGILPIANTDARIAAVMGHEVAHALANHGQQRMSAGQLQQVGAVAGNIALSKNPENQAIFNTAYGVGSNVGVMLPFSRSHESEADKIGLTLMAIAGYDPLEAAELWKRMQTNAGGQAPPEFLSTHPASETRINNINSWVAEAKAEARKYGVTTFQK
ncbi:MAG: peptidase M48 [Bacteroidetes bacterium HGW-Bacteroidetes-2]|nr:MAG: peptidase M48 [Bacteroidetes bacterium HGW-Bacteroidetes-2]